MFAPERILDRGRMLLGALLVVPLGVVSIGAGGIERDSGPADAEWAVTALGPNPIDTTPPTVGDVLANLTSASVATPASAPAAEPAPTDTAAPSTSTGASASPSPEATRAATAVLDGEVGSESADDGTPPQAVNIPGTAPDAALAEQLRKAQSRFAPQTPSAPTPSNSPSDGPLPFATPGIAAYPIPAGAGHVFPIVGGASFSNDWGGPRPGGRRHQGIDLFAKTGTPVVAISDGTLFKVGWNRVGGWRFWLRDQWGNEFYHAHLSAFAPAAVEGATVKAGTVIGFVGNTGDARTTPPHVHFEIHPGGGGPIPPFTYVSGWPRL